MASIAIDGPSGVGKSTLARAAAKELGYLYIDTGAFYRAVTLSMLNRGVDTSNPQAVERALGGVGLEIRYENGEQRMFLDGEDASEAIRAPGVTRKVSEVSANGAVRDFLVAEQRKLASRSDVVMDGRDIGTVVLPGAEFKFYLTAGDGVRAQRRYREYIAKGVDVSYNEVLEDMRKRDHYDSNREIAPLKPAPGAIIIDTSKMSFEEVLARLISVVKGTNR